MRLALVGMLVACTPTPQPVEHPIANATPAAKPAPPPSELPPGCEPEPSDDPIVLDGAPVAIAACAGAEVPVEGTTMKSRDYVAYLVRSGHAFVLGTWNQGWEWGGSFSISGVLPGNGAGGVVFVTQATGSIDGGSATLHAYQRTGASWTEVFTSDRASAVKLEIAADRRTATVKTCTTTDLDKPCQDDPARQRALVLTWDGAHLVR